MSRVPGLLTNVPAQSVDVTAAAKKEWNDSRAARATKPPAPTPKTPASSAHPARSDQEEQDSQSPRPANFRQLQRTQPNKRPRSASASSSIDAGPVRKQPYRSLSFSEEPVPSIVSAPSPSPDPELLDYQDPVEVVVGIPKDPGFDPSEYLSVAGSQSISYPSQSLTELEDQDQRLAFSSQFSCRTVPDSQEYSGQSLSTASQKPLEDILTSSADSPGAIIPDSLDREGERLIVAGDSNNAQDRIPESSIPQEVHSHSGIPSHQQDAKEQPPPDFSSLKSSQAIYQNTPDLLPETIEDSFPRSCHEEPAFLTQIEAQAPSISPSSSSAQLPSSPAQQAHLRPSQDAQVVSGFFATVLDRVTDSNKTNTTSDQNSLEVSEPPHHNTQPVSELDQDYEMAENMDNIPGDGASTQRSAVDELTEMFTLNPVEAGSKGITADGSEDIVPRVPSPSASGALDPSQWQPVTQPPEVLAADPSDVSSSILGLNTQPEANTEMLMPMHLHEDNAGTISPSDILGSVEAPILDVADPLLNPLGVMPTAVFGSSADPIPLGQESPGSPSSSTTSDDPVLMQHTITLPFQASLRPQYDEVLLAHRKHVKEFSEVFSAEDYVEPNPALVGKIDELFVGLRNLCDFPRDIVGTTLETLSAKEQVKYACDANPKFCFVFELLQGIETDIRVLIVGQSVNILRLLANVAESLEIDCAAKALEELNNDSHGSACSVTLALPNEEFDIDDFEVVIGFDHTFGNSPVARALSPEAQASRPPLVLTLVTTHSIEHISQHLPDDLEPLERKNALLAGIVNARRLTTDPDRGYPEPHDIATMFCDFLNGAVEGVLWEPVPLPEEVLDVYMSLQSEAQPQSPAAEGEGEGESSRKRKLDDDNEEDVKRVRTIPKEPTTPKEDAPLPDDVALLLNSVAGADQSQPGANVHVRISLAVLQALAEKNAELERRAAANDMEAQYKGVIQTLEAQVKEYERTSRKTYHAYREAVEQRTLFDREKKKADAALLSAQETAEKEKTKLQTKVGALEATVSRLTSAGEGEGEGALAASERLLKEAQDKVQLLERRLENAKQDGEYAKNAYQEASNAASVRQSENKELREQNEKLQKRSADNVTRIHEIQSESMAKTYLRQIEEMGILLREREAELDRARDEVRLARSRRDTRQASVQGSPRMGLMSPRTGRPYANPASRGTSPTAEGAAMIGALPVSGNQNGRWNHLRE